MTLLAAGVTLTTPPLVRQGIAQGLPEGFDKLQSFAPRPLADFSFTTGEGEARRVADFAGKPLLINLWATWCPPCVAEMPALDRSQAALEREGWLVLPLSSDRGGKPVVEAFMARIKTQRLGIWLDPRGAAARALGARGLPTTLVVDREGREVGRLEGAAAWDHPVMLDRLRAMVGTAPGAGPKPDPVRAI